MIKNNNTIEYENRIVAFLDILGFKDIIKHSQNDKSKIELIYTILNFLKDWEDSEKWDLTFTEIEEDTQRKGIKNFDIRGKTNCTSFSDSIVISVKIEDNNINEMLTTLIANISYIGARLLENGILLRGGITYGKIIHGDNGTVFGQALVDAFELEKEHSKYPRIILSHKLIKELNYPLDTIKKNRYPYHSYINRFNDGCVGFHQMQHYTVMQSWEKITHNQLTQRLNNCRNEIIKGLDNNFDNPHVFFKYKWLKEQYQNLNILPQFDILTGKTINNIKQKFYELKELILEYVIHYKVHEDQFNNKSK